MHIDEEIIYAIMLRLCLHLYIQQEYIILAVDYLYKY